MKITVKRRCSSPKMTGVQGSKLAPVFLGEALRNSRSQSSDSRAGREPDEMRKDSARHKNGLVSGSAEGKLLPTVASGQGKVKSSSPLPFCFFPTDLTLTQITWRAGLLGTGGSPTELWLEAQGPAQRRCSPPFAQSQRGQGPLLVLPPVMPG